MLGSDSLNNLIRTANETKENTGKVKFSEIFTGSKNVTKLAIDKAIAGTKNSKNSTFVYDPFRTAILCR